jgi:hypothetical protein
MARKMEQQSQTYYSDKTSQQDVNISPNRKESKLDPDIGEYVDFEEIKDNEQKK